MTTQCSKYAGLTSVQDIVQYFMETKKLSKSEALEIVESRLRIKIPDIIRDLIPEVITI